MPVTIVDERLASPTPRGKTVSVSDMSAGQGLHEAKAFARALTMARNLTGRFDRRVTVIAPSPAACRADLSDRALLDKELTRAGLFPAGGAGSEASADVERATIPPMCTTGAGLASAEMPQDLAMPRMESATCGAPRQLGGHPSLDEELSHLDEGFSDMLMRKIDELGMTDAECYRRANVDRRLFSKIRSNPDYRPSKRTAVSFAVALRLSPEETEELLGKAGFALSHSSAFDVICAHYIQEGVYDVMRINQALYAYDQPLLGS
ncbi:MAG: hypothetical protein SOI26_07985 [Coriobacteriales bacterium]|jgi:hypothetical protein